ncbi:thiol:disulfide interchange protein DsbA/DsbL [Pseudoduganella sp. GCM10020061]|uniref:thiol:disulfide interchange protein DsbA/DsbL n=1 Tax=Pseudoduganella sp. GCM10020061 TaxID=3317345 RepID=UPI00362F83E9
MRSLRFVVAAAGMAVATAFASPTSPKVGVEYVELAQPVPAQTVGKKVEVIEFFMYHCPACNSLEPLIAGWAKRQGDNIHFRRVHMPATGPNDPEAHLHLTLEAMGLSEQMSARVFHAMHVQRVRLNREEVIFEWIAKQGIDTKKFKEYWNSFGVKTKLRRVPQVLNAYKVESVPTVIIDGRYVTSPAIVSKSGAVTGTAFTQVLDALVAKAAASKK